MKIVLSIMAMLAATMMVFCICLGQDLVIAIYLGLMAFVFALGGAALMFLER